MANCKILIVDDEAPARRRLVELIGDVQAEMQSACQCEIVGEAAGAQEALDIIAQLEPDIILLDVQMPEMTGLELAQHLIKQPMKNPPSVIFVTAYDEFALQAFEVHAQDYLLKPVRASRLLEAIKRVSLQRSYRGNVASVGQSGSTVDSANVTAQPTRRTCFSILERNRVLLIPVADVLFLKAEQKYLTVHTKARSYLLEESLSAIEQEMSDRLVRVHRNALVARNAIIGVERASQLVELVDGEGDGEKSNDKLFDKASDRTTDSWQVIVRDSNERLPISRRQWPTIKALVR
jgi:two-component system response regulator AlgR